MTAPRRWRVRISHKIILYFLIVLVIPLAVSVFLVARDLERRADVEIQRQAGFALRITSNFLVRLKDAHLVKLNYLANEDGGLLAALNGPREGLAAFVTAKGAAAGFSSIGVVDRDGRLASGGERPGDPEADPIRSARAGEQAAEFHLDGPEPRLEAAVPVIGGGVPRGTVLAGRILLAPDFLDPVKDITDMEISLYPGSGDRRAATTLVGADAHRSRDAGVPAYVRKELQREPLATAEEEFLGRPFVVAYGSVTPGDPHGGYLSVAVPREMFQRTSTMIVRTLYGVGAISLLLAVVAGWLLSASIARPLKEFARMADRISEGRFDERVALPRSDEIGDLARNFNGMAGKLQGTMERLERRMFEVSTLYAVSSSMNFMNNTEQLLTMILEKSVQALDAARGSLMLVNPETFELEVSVVTGWSEVVEKRLRFKPGEGVAGIALETGRTQLLTDVAADPRFRSYKETELSEKSLRNMLCVPLKMKDQVSGVINIINKKEGRTFSEDDVRLLEALATQAAVTIENAKLYELSITDGMTRLFIHRYFQVRLDEELRRAGRYGGEVSLIMTDVDHFKKFNDTYGHQTGDRVLVRVAQLMRDAIRKEVDIPCRYGGEEFTIIAPSTGQAEAQVMAERLRKMVEAEPLEGPAGEKLQITISLGVSTFPGDSKDKRELIQLADRALYQSKESGRNRTTHASELRDAAEPPAAGPPVAGLPTAGSPIAGPPAV